MMNILTLIYLLLLLSFSTCESRYSSANTSVHQFRKQVEEIEEETPKSNNDDFTNLFSLLINNVKDFFGDENIKNYNNYTKTRTKTTKNKVTPIVISTTMPIDTTTVEYEITYGSTPRIEKPLRTQFTEEEEGDEETPGTRRFNEPVYNNYSLYLTTPRKPHGPSLSFLGGGMNDQENPNDLPDGLDNAVPVVQYLNETDEEATTELLYLSKSPSVIELRKDNEFDNSTKEMKASLSCIKCNNVDLVECYDPLNKLVLSVICDDYEDLCYSTHTPFGIIDRGCFNVRRFMSTYVCACNLCNYIPISEMPVVFSRKSDWIDNVFELSRTRRFKDSIFKSMLCLRCEVNVTAESGNNNKMENVNCLEGNVGTLPTQECKADEICAVRSIRRYGYIWRGCISQPLFNYWWTFCDSDLCNYDPLITIYDDNTEGF